jgi:PKD repeat protein
MKKFALFLAAICLSQTTSFSQFTKDDNPCGITKATLQVNEHMQEVFNKHPELKIQHEEMLSLLEKNRKVTIEKDGSRSFTYVVPVVFHVMHMYGSENVNDAQIYQSMDVINRQWQHNDPDSVTIIPEFKQVAGGLNIEFRLANIDPYGNCTNGIEHIYSHETYNGDTYVKINQWDRAKYLNIWLSQQADGAGGYAIYPAGTDGLQFWTDGIVGATGQSLGGEITLSHEIAHYLNISHVWGNTNDPEVQCGDDGVLDTPPTAGHSGNGGCNSAWLTGPANRVCDPDTIENAQNYMDYSFCGVMFSKGQMTRAENALLGVSGLRNNLWNDTTLAATGTHDTSTYQLCAPVADFHTPDTRICQGGNALFTDHSWNAVVDNRTWTFEDGTPATSSNAIVNVTFNSPGWKTITLEVSNSAGSDTRTETSYLYVSPQWADYTGPAELNIEGSQHELFLVENPENNWGKFNVVNGVGIDGTKAFKLNNFKDVSNADPFTADGFYYQRLGGSIDNLVTPSFDLRNTTSVTVGFWYSYATNATQVSDIEEVLKVYSTRNCGDSWTTRKTIQGAQLTTGGYAGNADYAPMNNDMWEYASFTYPTNSQDNLTRFMFEFEASDKASNLYIDNINISGILSLESTEIKDLELTVFPNPTKGEAINVRYTAQNEAVEFILRDMTGKIISSENVSTTNATVTHQIEGSTNLPSAPYFLEVRSGDYSTTKKIVVL